MALKRFVLLGIAASAVAACVPGTATPQNDGKPVTRDVRSGQSIEAAVNASSAGDTVLVHDGSYSHVTLSKRFRGRPLHILGAGDHVLVNGLSISGGAGYVITSLNTNSETRIDNDAHDIIVDRLHCSMGTASNADGGSCIYIHDSAHRIIVRQSTLRGGWDAIKFYGCPGRSWAHDVQVTGNDLSGASEDDVHIDCARNVIISHNYIHDPIDTSDHNDGVQSQASDGLQILANRFSFQSVRRAGGPNQAIIIGGVADFPDHPVTRTRIANNLVSHWNGGAPLIVAGTRDTQVVNNTFVDSAGPTDASIYISWQSGASNGWYQNSDVEIWNNILAGVYVEPGANQPSYCAANMIAVPSSGICSAARRRGSPDFANHATYALAARSAARNAGIARDGTPRVDIDGRARPKERPDLGSLQTSH